MPVEHAEAFEDLQRGGLAFFRQSQLVPAELGLRSRVDTRGEHRGERLRAEANADGRDALLHHRLDDVQLVFQERIAVDLVYADRSAEDRYEIGVLGGRKIVDAGLQIGEADAAALEHGLERAGILEGDMADGDGIFHGFLSAP